MIALLPLLVQLAGEFGPTLAGMLLGQKAGDVVGSVIKVAKDVFGTDDPAAISDAAKNNPDLVQQYIERLKAETEQYKASLLDVQDARATTVKLVSAGSAISWGAPVISTLVTIGFIIVLVIWTVKPPATDASTLNILSILFGSLSTSFGAVVQFWIGSSAGSREKDASLNTALISAQANTQVAMTNGKPK